jgi:hypothetical protein
MGNTKEEIKVKLLECARWRWEFMRRNPDYQADYHKCRTQGKSEEAFCEKWEIDTRSMPDPAKSWEQLRREGTDRLIEKFKAQHIGMEIPTEFSKLIEDFEKHYATKAFLSDGVEIVHGRMGSIQDIDLANLSDNDLVLHIDFSKINSVANLKKYISHIIEEQAEIDLKVESGPFLVKSKKIDPYSKRASKYGIDYEVYLKAWDMRNSGADYKCIFKELDPRGYKRGYTEKGRDKIKWILKECEKLIFGGYKRITYP